MCGIAGIVGDPSSADRIRSMLKCLEHRGPDDVGVWSAHGTAIGHRRLAVLDLTQAARQPMTSRDGRLIVSFNGEVYNHVDLRQELVNRGHHFVSHGDTEVVVRALEEWGESALERFTGMFALAWWDRDERTMTLARDRLGEKPLYYCHLGSRLAFASELAALEQLPWLPTEVDMDAVALLLMFRAVPSPWTIRRGVNKLPPGTILRFDADGRVSCRRYWSAVACMGTTGPGDDVSAVERTEHLILGAVRQQMVADRPVGVFLSGGVDSSLIAAMMAECATGTVNSFTIGFKEAPYDERHKAADVAARLGTNHRVEIFDEQAAMDLVPALPEIYGEPFADPTGLATHLLAGMAREHVTVCLTGDGGDENFGGYRRYGRVARWAPILGLLGLLPGRGRWLNRIPVFRDNGVDAGGFTLHQMYRSAMSGARESWVKCLTGSIPPGYPPEDVWERTWVGPRRRAMLSDLTAYLPDQLLTKVDRATMAHGLEARSPLLDHGVVEAALRLPDQLMSNKRILRGLVGKRLPGLDFSRPKQGFVVPIGSWLRGGLRPLVMDTITDGRLRERGIADPRTALDLVLRHMEGEDHADLVWALMALCLWPVTRNQGASRLS